MDFLDAKITLASNEKDISVTNNVSLQLDKDIENKNREPSLGKSTDSIDVSIKNDIEYNNDEDDKNSTEKLNASDVFDISNEENCMWNICEN